MLKLGTVFYSIKETKQIYKTTCFNSPPNCNCTKDQIYREIKKKKKKKKKRPNLKPDPLLSKTV